MRTKAGFERELGTLRSELHEAFAEVERKDSAHSAADARVAQLEAHLLQARTRAVGKLPALSQMVRDQQAQLSETYRLAASFKLAAAVDLGVAVCLARGFSSWMLVCRAISPQLLSAEVDMAPPPLDMGGAALPPDARLDASPAAKPVVVEDCDDAIAADVEDEILEDVEFDLYAGEAPRASPAEAGSSSPSSPPPLLSTRTSLAEQLEEQLSRRSQRRESRGVDELPTSCAFCGLPAANNVVTCRSCHADVRHMKCLNSKQAARFKGRSWQCDSCLEKGH